MQKIPREIFLLRSGGLKKLLQFLKEKSHEYLLHGYEIEETIPLKFLLVCASDLKGQISFISYNKDTCEIFPFQTGGTH
jgi:hypothetical protein